MLEERNATACEPSRLTMRVGMSIAEAERRLIEATLRTYGGDKRRTAQTLGISLKTLYNRLHRFSAEDRNGGGLQAD